MYSAGSLDSLFALLSLTGAFSIAAFWDWHRNSAEVRKTYTALVLYTARVNLVVIAVALKGLAAVYAPVVLAGVFACVRL